MPTRTRWIVLAVLLVASGVIVAGCWYRSCGLIRNGVPIALPQTLDVWVYEGGAAVVHVSFVGDERLSQAFETWMGDTGAWRPTLTNYAPGLIARTDSGCTIKFSGSLVVVNCSGQQWKRNLTDADIALKNAVLSAIESRGTPNEPH